MKNKRYQFLLSAVGILGIIFIISGVTYAFFSYAKQGSKTNILSSGDVKFLYTENPNGGRGIVLTDAMPMTDIQGKAQTGTDSYFDFRVTAKSGRNISIPYTVTARVSDDSTLDASVVKVWLSDQSNNEIVPVKYFGVTNAQASNNILDRFTGVSYASKYNERVLYTGTVPANMSQEYIQNFRLRMWIDENTDFSPVESVIPASCSIALAEGVEITEDNCTAVGGQFTAAQVEVTYPYNNKTFRIIVNVYANGQVVSEDINASQVGYYNTSSTQCTAEDNRTVECALNELKTRLDG